MNILESTYHNSLLVLWQGDITLLDCDAVVNAANNSLLGGGGVDGAIHSAAGPLLLEECKSLNGCETGQAKITGGYNLFAKFIIHAVGPKWMGGNEEEESLLRSTYTNALMLADQYKCKSIALPAISTGVYKYPKKEATRIALETIKEFVTNKLNDIEKIYLVCYEEEMTTIYRNALEK